LGRKISGLLGDAPARERMAAVGLLRARDFGWNRICADYEALYASPLPAAAEPVKTSQ